MMWENYLKGVYYDPANAGSFSGPDKLYRYVRKAGKYVISKHRIRQWLHRQEAYSLQRPVRRHFKRNTVITTGIDDQWDADLIDMSKYKTDNNGQAYVLIVIDIFSKYVWLRSLSTKMGKDVERAFAEILDEGRHPNRVRTDKGQEFRSKEFNRLLKDRRIEHLYAQNTEIKANYAERAIKTIKSKIHRYMTYKMSNHYTDHLQDFADNYNGSYHRTIGMAPKTVTKSKETELWWRMYWHKKQNLTGKAKVIRKPFRFKLGDHVRITYIRNPFTREYDEKWTGEIFKISQRILRGGLPVYRIKDFNDDEIKGTFYQSELQKTSIKDDDMWKVETIIKSRGKGQNKQYFVKWLHWPKKFNSWISARDVNNLCRECTTLERLTSNLDS